MMRLHEKLQSILKELRLTKHNMPFIYTKVKERQTFQFVSADAHVCRAINLNLLPGLGDPTVRF